MFLMVAFPQLVMVPARWFYEFFRICGY